MHKKVLLLILTVLVFVAVIVGAGLMFLNFGKEKRYTYKADDDVYPNPYIGFAPDCDSIELCQESTLVYMNLKWSDLEPIEGVYAWEKIEKQNHLKQWREDGKHLVLRFVCDYPTSEEHMDIPEWLYDKTGDGQFYDLEYGRGYCPDYNNEVFIEEHKKVIAEIGRHFSEDGFLAYVELGSLGHWGEWHTYYRAGIPRMPKTDVRSLYVQHYEDAFPYARLLMRRPFAEMPEAFGVYNDMTGDEDETLVWLDWIENGGTFNDSGESDGIKAAGAVWERAPIGGEFTSGIPMSTMLGADLDKTIELLKNSHMSFIGPKIPEDKREDGIIIKGQKEVLKNLGYRYRVSTMTMKNMSGGDKLITITMVNDGTAPVYFDYVPCLYVEDADGNVLDKQELSIDLMSLCQNCEESCEVTISKDILKEKGTRIYIGIEGAADDTSKIYLTMKAEREEEKSLLWGNE